MSKARLLFLPTGMRNNLVCNTPKPTLCINFLT